MKETDVKLVNVPTHETAQTLASGNVDAIGAWQPNAGQALKAVAGSKAIFTSADCPGLIYDLVCVSPQSLAPAARRLGQGREGLEPHRRFVTDPANKAEAVKIMAGRAGVPPEEYAKFLPGTRFLTPEEALDALREEGRRSSRCTAAARSPTSSTSRTRSTPQPQPVADVHRRLAGQGSARQAAAPSAPRSSAWPPSRR